MKGSGLEDLEQQQHHLQLHVPRHHLHELQKPEINGAPCIPDKEDIELTRMMSSEAGGNRLKGEVVISNLHSQQVFDQDQVASNRHSCLAAEAWGAPKKMDWTGLEAFRERLEITQRAFLVGHDGKHPVQLTDEATKQGMGLHATSRDLKLSGNSSRSCRICNKQFSSGRALGGHMRVHGPLFTASTPGISLLSRSYGVPDANLTQREDTGDEEEEGTPSIVDPRLDAESQQDLPQLDARSPGQNGADATVLFNRADNGYAGELDAFHAEDDLNSVERRSLSFNCNSTNSHFRYKEEARIEASPTAARRSPLYKLRHNPKRSRWFAEQQFTFEASMELSGKDPPLSVDGSRVCSECGKAFWSERALFGHLRCHSDRDRRVVLSQENSSEQPAARVLHRRKRVLVAEKFMESSVMQIGPKRAEDLFKRTRPAAEAEVSVETRKEASHMIAEAEVTNEEELADEREAEVFMGDEEQKHECTSSDMQMNGVIAPARWPSAGRRSRRKVGLNKAGSMEIRNKETSSSTPEDEPALTSETISFELGVEEQEIETPDFLILLAEAARKIEEESQLLVSAEKYSHVLNHAKRSKHLQLDAAHRCPHEDESGGDQHEDAFSGHERPLVQGSIGKYECTTCKKTFSTHQALGGHRASHKKTKGCFARTGSSEASEEHSLEQELELGRHVEEKGAMMKKKKRHAQIQQVTAFKGHACSICNRIFLTGQALGGHKRCHWTGEKPSETASIASTNKQPSLQSEGQSSMIEGGIDLNMPAPMDEDADEVDFVAEVGLLNGEIADRESEDERRNATGLDLALDTSALAWSVKDLLKDDISSSSPQVAKKETEVRRRFDGIWGQHWPNNIGVTHTQLHQPVYAMQSLV